VFATCAFLIAQMPIHLARITNRPEDYYISLVGELFKSLSEPEMSRSDWAQSGNAFLQFSAETSDQQLIQTVSPKITQRFLLLRRFTLATIRHHLLGNAARCTSA
jgi:hypothetical protein